ncbi:MAG: hypothetical protein LBU89_11050 [Fibromonadaceae bacterium]|jgi:hypothetical protein|nr:hypothetical protein [Fibromonadaceae bacterium]
MLLRAQKILLVLFSSLCAQQQGLTFSGIFESAVSTRYSDSLSYGVEEYANIRMQSRIGQNATFFGAVNLVAGAGDFAYDRLIELERLHFRLNGETINFDGGLMRLPFGYGQVWNPSDFINPKNPLLPNARPIAVLGAGLSWYPTDSFKFMEFAAAPRDSSQNGLAGFLAEQHWERASLQLLYSYEFSGTDTEDFHRAGMSLKADLELSFMIDMLYTFNKDEKSKEGLVFSGGFDYSMFSGNLIVLTEYLYNGGENNLYSGFTWRFSDYTNAGAALLAGIDDNSFIPIAVFNHELFQGASFNIMAQRPLNSELPYDFNLEARLRLRF